MLNNLTELNMKSLSKDIQHLRSWHSIDNKYYKYMTPMESSYTTNPMWIVC